MSNSRTTQRGKPLLPMCRKAAAARHEYGREDKRVFCHGLQDKMTDEYLEECKSCGAFKYNAKPLEGKNERIHRA